MLLLRIGIECELGGAYKLKKTVSQLDLCASLAIAAASKLNFPTLRHRGVCYQAPTGTWLVGAKNVRNPVVCCL